MDAPSAEPAMEATAIGLISDTHGLLRPEALNALSGVETIIHAGDIGSPHIIERLQRIAPVTAIRGNNDKGTWAAAIAETVQLEVRGRKIHVLHDLAELELDPVAAGIAVVVSGHSHKPRIEQREGVLYVNPGSAGPRRFRLPVSIAKLYIDASSARAEIVELRVPA